MRAAVLVLNELSYIDWHPDEPAASSAISDLAGAISVIRRQRLNSYLLSGVPVREIVFGNGLPLTRFLSVASVKDQVRLIMGFANRAPYAAGGFDSSGYDCNWEGRAAIGLLHAMLLSGVALSFPSHDRWLEPLVQVEVTAIDESRADGDLIVSNYSVLNVCNEAVADANLKDIGEDNFTDGGQLLGVASDIFPNLSFTQQARHQISSLGADAEILRQVILRFRQLQSAVAKWDVAKDAFPSWESHVSPEGEQRKRLTKFEGLDGAEHTYDLHARYTPGKGRIHMRLLRDVRGIEIAYVGEKIL